jgi:hypothetical protein
MKKKYIAILLALTPLYSVAETATFNGQEYNYTQETDLSINEPIVVDGTLYVPRSYRIRKEHEPNMLERIVGRAVKSAAFEVESTISNGIDRKIYDASKKLEDKIY